MDALQTTKLENVKDLPKGDMKVVKTGDREILLIHSDSGIHALDNFCIHGGCRLVNGRLKGEILYCLCHGSEFNVNTGEVMNGPATAPQPAYSVVTRNGEITLAP